MLDDCDDLVDALPVYCRGPCARVKFGGTGVDVNLPDVGKWRFSEVLEQF